MSKICIRGIKKSLMSCLLSHVGSCSQTCYMELSKAWKKHVYVLSTCVICMYPACRSWQGVGFCMSHFFKVIMLPDLIPHIAAALSCLHAELCCHMLGHAVLLCAVSRCAFTYCAFPCCAFTCCHAVRFNLVASRTTHHAQCILFFVHCPVQPCVLPCSPMHCPAALCIALQP